MRTLHSLLTTIQFACFNIRCQFVLVGSTSRDVFVRTIFKYYPIIKSLLYCILQFMVSGQWFGLRWVTANKSASPFSSCSFCCNSRIPLRAVRWTRPNESSVHELLLKAELNLTVSQKSNRKAMNRTCGNQKANPALKTKIWEINKYYK